MRGPSLTICSISTRTSASTAASARRRSASLQHSRTGTCGRSSSDEDLVGRISMEGSRKLRGLNCDLRRQVNELYAWIGESRLNPIDHWDCQHQAANLYQLRHLPA